MSFTFFALALLFPSLAFAASQPCLDGSCTIQITNATTGVTTGTVFLNGSTSAISDLTEAAGWTILGCDAQNKSNSVRAICTGSNSTCSHLYNNGANNTIVRLPQGCGEGPLARVVNEWKHENQTIPADVHNVLSKRGGESNSTVRGILLDTNWTAVDPSHHGPVSLYVLATTGHDANATANAAIATRDIQDRSLFDKLKQISSNVTSNTQKPADQVAHNTQESVDNVVRSELDERSFWSDIGSSISSAANTVANAVSGAASTVANDVSSAASTVANDVSSAASTVANDVTQPFSTGNQSGSTPFSGSISKTFATDSFTCAGNQYNPSFETLYNINALAAANGTLTYGLVIAGTVIPPDLTQFSMDVGIDADISSTVTWSGIGGLSTSTGWITLLTVPLTPFSIADIITIGPYFQLNVEATQQVQSVAVATVDLAFAISGAKLSIPDGSSAGTFTPKDTNLEFTAGTGVANNGSVTAHVIPTLQLGLNAFGGKAQTSVNVNLDASVTLDLSLEQNSGKTYTGTVEIDTGLSVNAGASATFFSFLNTYKQYTIASHSWKLWSKSWTGQTRRDHPRELPAKRVGLPAGMSCRWPGETTLENIVLSKITGSSLAQLF